MQNKKLNDLLKCFEPVLDCISELFGSNCEVVLHDVNNPEHSIIKINNGQVTGRQVGSPLTDLAFQMVKEADKGMTVLGNYNPRTSDGRLLKSNAVNIRDPQGKLIGILCINFDVSQFINAEDTIRQFYNVSDENSMKQISERYETDIRGVIQSMIAEIIHSKAKPVHRLKKSERLEIIEILDQRGVFLTRGANFQVAESLGISQPTLYKYLEEIRFKAKKNQ